MTNFAHGQTTIRLGEEDVAVVSYPIAPKTDALTHRHREFSSKFNSQWTEMMKQWQFTKSGLPRDILTLVDVPIPTTCAEDEVLVKISHVSLNAAFTYRLMAYYGVFSPLGALLGRPAVPEMDFSGIVCGLRGAKAKEFQTGDRVLGIAMTGIRDLGNGVLREYALVKYDHIIKVPENVSLKDAACFPATAYTAYCFIVERAKLKEGERIFIHGASGAVGVMAVQLARKVVGPTGRVVATCSPSKVELVRNLGADEVIDYKSHYLPDYLQKTYGNQPFHVILDIVGTDHALYSHSPAYLSADGLFCTIGMVEIGSTYWSATGRVLQLLSAMFLPTYLGGVPRRHIFEPLRMAPLSMVATVDLVEQGVFKAVIDSTYKFTETVNAYDRMMSREVTGKVVIAVNELD